MEFSFQRISIEFYAFQPSIDFQHTIFQQVLHQLVILRFITVQIYNQSQFQQVLQQFGIVPLIIPLVYAQFLFLIFSPIELLAIFQIFNLKLGF